MTPWELMLEHCQVNLIDSLSYEKPKPREENVLTRAELDSVSLSRDSMIPEVIQVIFSNIPDRESMENRRIWPAAVKFKIMRSPSNQIMGFLVVCLVPSDRNFVGCIFSQNRGPLVQKCAGQISTSFYFSSIKAVRRH